MKKKGIQKDVFVCTTTKFLRNVVFLVMIYRPLVHQVTTEQPLVPPKNK